MTDWTYHPGSDHWAKDLGDGWKLRVFRDRHVDDFAWGLFHHNAVIRTGRLPPSVSTAVEQAKDRALKKALTYIGHPTETSAPTDYSVNPLFGAF